MKFYIQTNKDGYITDCIQYEYPGYVPHELDVPLPPQFIAGWWKLVDGKPVEDEAEKARLAAEQKLTGDA